MAQRRERVLGLEQRVLLQRAAAVRDRRRLALEQRRARCGRRRDAVAAAGLEPARQRHQRSLGVGVCVPLGRARARGQRGRRRRR